MANFPRSHHKLRKPSHTFTSFHRWIHMCNLKDDRAFTLHIISFSIFKLCDSIWTFVPFSEPAQSTPKAVLIYNHENHGTLLYIIQSTVSTSHSPRMMNDNNHAHTPISCDVHMNMKCNYVISCLCHVTHTHTHTHTHIYIYIYTSSKVPCLPLIHQE